MVLKRVVALTLVMYVCLSGVLCSAQEILPRTENPGFYQSLELTKFLNSFASYEFPNPFPPGHRPSAGWSSRSTNGFSVLPHPTRPLHGHSGPKDGSTLTTRVA